MNTKSQPDANEGVSGLEKRLRELCEDHPYMSIELATKIAQIGATHERGRLAKFVDECADECTTPIVWKMLRTVAGCMRDPLAVANEMLPKRVA